MKDNETREKFVELRAQGKSFVAIAEELGVSKPTLIDWSHDMQVQIANLRALNDEAMYARFKMSKEHELQMLTKQLNTVQTEIERRGITDLPTDKLFNLLFKLSNELREQDKPVILQRNEGFSMIDLETKSKWEA